MNDPICILQAIVKYGHKIKYKKAVTLLLTIVEAFFKCDQ